MKTIIAGSRTYTDTNSFVFALKKLYKLDGFRGITEFVVGGANGADTIGENFAKLSNTPFKKFLPEWDKYGCPRAAYKRNLAMAKYADRLIAFWDGKSTGTEHMIKCMRAYPDKEVYIFYFEDNVRYDIHANKTSYCVLKKEDN